MPELTEEEQIAEQKKLINKEIEALTEAKAFPETVKRLMATPEWKEVIEKVYIDEFAKDLVRSYDEYDEERRADFDDEYKVRSRFLNCIQAWAETGDQADNQIARYREMIESLESTKTVEEPKIAVN